MNNILDIFIMSILLIMLVAAITYVIILKRSNWDKIQTNKVIENENKDIEEIEIKTFNIVNKDEYIDKKSSEITYPFKRVYLLTKNEWNFYKRLKMIIDKYNLSIITKVRLADLVEVDTNKSINYQEDFDRIKAKHIDFAIVKSDNMEVKFLIELDDKSHEFSDRVSRDLFVNRLCTETGYTLIRTYGNTDEIENLLNSSYFMFKKQELKTVQNNYNDKLLKEMAVKINKMERLLTETDSEPYIIEKED